MPGQVSPLTRTHRAAVPWPSDRLGARLVAAAPAGRRFGLTWLSEREMYKHKHIHAHEIEMLQPLPPPPPSSSAAAKTTKSIADGDRIERRGASNKWFSLQTIYIANGGVVCCRY